MKPPRLNTATRLRDILGQRRQVRGDAAPVNIARDDRTHGKRLRRLDRLRRLK